MEITGFEHLHLHSDHSTLDGLSTIEEYAERAPQINQKFITVTDHGMMGVIPRQIRACEKINDRLGSNTLSPIYGCELYCNPLQPESTGLAFMQSFIKNLDEEQKKQIGVSAHLLAIAYNEIGYRNLVRLSSWAWTKGFYKRPRVNHEQLKKYKEGIIFTSCCYASEVGKAFDNGLKISPEQAEQDGFAVIEKYIEMFGKENYLLEIMLLDFVKQKPYNQFIIKAKEKYGLKLIVSTDCHYVNKGDSKFQRLMLMVQTQRTIQDIQRALKENDMQDFFELQDTNLWMKSEEEINEKWVSDYQDVIPYELFCEAKRTTVEICNKAKGVQLDRTLKLPQIEDADEKLKDEIMKGFARRGLEKTNLYLARVKEEYSLITRKGFASYFLIQQMMTDEARRVYKDLLGWGDGSQAIGPGRGSAAGSLVCFLLGITSVNPIKEGLLFSRFLSENRGGRSLVLEFNNIEPII